MYPGDGVGSYTRTIPFKGAKESFLKRSGRNRFDGMNVSLVFVTKLVLISFAYLQCSNIDLLRPIQRARIRIGG